MKKILVLREKHGDRYFDVSTDEAKSAALIKIIAGRLAEGYWYSDKETIYGDKIDSTANQLDFFNKPVMSAKALAQRIVDTNDARLALRLMNAKKNSEYEGWYIDTVE